MPSKKPRIRCEICQTRGRAYDPLTTAIVYTGVRAANKAHTAGSFGSSHDPVWEPVPEPVERHTFTIEQLRAIVERETPTYGAGPLGQVPQWERSRKILLDTLLRMDAMTGSPFHANKLLDHPKLQQLQESLDMWRGLRDRDAETQAEAETLAKIVPADA